jgi:hypothetical protein
VSPERIARPAARLLRPLRSPLVRIAATGALLVLGRVAWQHAPRSGPPAVERPPIVVSAERARSLESGFSKRWGRDPSAPERAALIEESVREEVLYREARLLALGFRDPSVRRRLLELMRMLGDRPDRSDDELVRSAVELGLDDDVVIRRLLAEKMRLLLRQDQDGGPIRDADLVAVLERNRERFARPETVTFEQLFLSTDARPADVAARDAGHLLASLESGELSTAGAASASDPLPHGGSLRSVTRLKLQGRFGKEFADAVFALEPGVWSGPIASPLGLHVVRVTERQPARLPAVDEVRPALVEALRQERAEASYARGLLRLRALYDVRIEAPPAQRPSVDVASAR